MSADEANNTAAANCLLIRPSLMLEIDLILQVYRSNPGTRSKTRCQRCAIARFECVRANP